MKKAKKGGMLLKKMVSKEIERARKYDIQEKYIAFYTLPYLKVKYMPSLTNLFKVKDNGIIDYEQKRYTYVLKLLYHLKLLDKNQDLFMKYAISYHVFHGEQCFDMSNLNVIFDICNTIKNGNVALLRLAMQISYGFNNELTNKLIEPCLQYINKNECISPLFELFHHISQSNYKELNKKIYDYISIVLASDMDMFFWIRNIKEYINSDLKVSFMNEFYQIANKHGNPYIKSHVSWYKFYSDPLMRQLNISNKEDYCDLDLSFYEKNITFYNRDIRISIPESIHTLSWKRYNDRYYVVKCNSYSELHYDFLKQKFHPYFINKNCFTLLIYNIKNIYIRYHDSAHNKYFSIRPLTLKDLNKIMKLYKEAEFIKKLFAIIKEQSPLFKDYENENYMWNIPITLNELMDYHTKEELLKSKYKNAKKLNFKINKKNLNISYLIMKCLSYIEERDYNRLMAIDNDFPIQKYISGDLKTKECIHLFLSAILIESISKKKDLNNDEITLIKDFIKIKINSKEKIPLRIKSIRRIEEEHRRQNEFYLMHDKYSIPNGVKVPKDSIFNELRKKLPSDFIWIKSKRRLIKEAYEMSNCVWTYADSINEDKIAIYSFHYHNERYTLEFGIKNNRYYIKQMQLPFNAGYSKEAYKFINDLL